MMTTLNSVIMTVPDIGYLDGVMIFDKIVDIHWFRAPSKLLALAGLNHSVHLSCKFKARCTRVSKCASRIFNIYKLILLTTVSATIKFSKLLRFQDDSKPYSIHSSWSLWTQIGSYNK